MEEGRCRWLSAANDMVCGGTEQILKAKETDQRAQLFARTLKSGNDMLSANRKLLLRMRLYGFIPRCAPSPSPDIFPITSSQQAELIVKQPKDRQGAQPLSPHVTETAL